MKTTLSKLSIATVFVASFGAFSANAATIDLGFAIDESGSVSGQPNQVSSELGLIREGLASALDLIPSVGAPNNPNTYTVMIVRFASSASTLVTKTAINDTSRASIQNTLRTASRISGGTNIAGAVNQLTSEVCGIGENTCTADTTLFNVATDGSGTSPIFGSPSANDQAIAAGVDGISYEAIGGGAQPTSIANFAFPGTVQVVDLAAGDTLPNPLNNAFVIDIAGFEDFENAIAAKVGRVVEDTGGGGTNVIPLPAGLPLLLTGLAVLGLVRRKKA